MWQQLELNEPRITQNCESWYACHMSGSFNIQMSWV